MTPEEDPSIQAQVEKLPKWAQGLIGNLRRELDACRASLAEVSPTYITWGMERARRHGMPSGYVPDTQPVRIYLDEQRYRWIEVRRMENHRVKLYGSHALVMAFQSSNLAVLSVDLKGDWLNTKEAY